MALLLLATWEEVFIGVVAAAAWFVLSVSARWSRRRWHFGRFHGEYRVTDKYGTELKDDTASIRVAGNVLSVKYRAMGNKAPEIAIGEIAMDDGPTAKRRRELYPSERDG